MTEKSKQWNDAESAFRRLQTRSIEQHPTLSGAGIANQTRDANTARLRELRLEKEAREREASAGSRKSSQPKSTPPNGK